MATELHSLKSLVIPLVGISAISNLATLVSPIFMMQVLDRVLASGNFATLFMLLLVAVGAYFAQAIAEFTRDSTLSRISRWVEKKTGQIALNAPLNERQRRIDEAGAISSFFGGSLAITCLNIPWLPLFLAAAVLIHPYFFALIILMVALMGGTRSLFDFLNRDLRNRAHDQLKQEQQMLANANSARVNQGILAIASHLQDKFQSLQLERHNIQDNATSAECASTSFLTLFRATTQILALALGAYLVVEGQLTAGGMIAASIIVSKATTTFDASISCLPRIISIWNIFKALLATPQASTNSFTEITELSGKLKVENLIYPKGQGLPPRLDRISFDLSAGQCLAIIGVSGSGKSTLLHAMCGIDPSPIGTVFLDETEIRTLGFETAKTQLGYLPQRAELVAGTIAENIGNFDPALDDERVIQAAKRAGVHGLISALPHSYDTDLTQEGYLLSAGQQQRIALARAIYYQPCYLFLDEPNALLDADGERQLCDTLARLKEAGTTIVMVLHRSGIMGLADKILRLDNGKVADFGNRPEVLQRMGSGKQRIELPLNPQSLQDLHDWIASQFARSSDTEFSQKTIMVGTELFNLASSNRLEKDTRNVVFTFKFTSAHACELLLLDPEAPDISSSLKKVKSVIAHPEPDMLELTTDELALAVVMQMADRLDFKKVKDSYIYATELSSGQTTRTGNQEVRLH